MVGDGGALGADKTLVNARGEGVALALHQSTRDSAIKCYKGGGGANIVQNLVTLSSNGYLLWTKKIILPSKACKFGI